GFQEDYVRKHAMNLAFPGYSPVFLFHQTICGLALFAKCIGLDNMYLLYSAAIPRGCASYHIAVGCVHTRSAHEFIAAHIDPIPLSQEFPGWRSCAVGRTIVAALGCAARSGGVRVDAVAAWPDGAEHLRSLAAATRRYRGRFSGDVSRAGAKGRLHSPL